MTLQVLGHVSISDGMITVTLPTDPLTYEPLNWPKRTSKHEGIGGAVTIQDFGKIPKDNTMHLSSGTNYIDLATVKSLLAFDRVKGATYTLTDWLDNSFTVFISEFRPVPTFIGDLWTFDMTLEVLAMTTLLGEAP